ncbi:MAG: VCBS repeat-containing protein [Verrucomicrobiota bacterium]|nr:VCBS repeat-containing protein [Verrucomicrobiota bacterium]
MSNIRFTPHDAVPLHVAVKRFAGKARKRFHRLACLYGLPMIMLLGCSKEEEPLIKTPASIPSSDAEETATGMGPSKDSIVTTGETKETVSLWSKAIKSQLKDIATSLMQVGTDPTMSVSLLESIEMQVPGLQEVSELHRSQSIRTLELRSPEKSRSMTTEPTVFLRHLQQLLAITPDKSQEKVSFKLFAINAANGQIQSRQRLMARGTVKGRPTHSSAVVDATWTMPADTGEKQSPQLVGWSMPVLVRNEIISDQEVAFDDIAIGVLGGNPAWREQLQWGMNTWGRHIDRSLNPDFLGYHGLAVGDVDGDGLEDLYVCQPGGLPNLLFQQQTDGTLIDVSSASRVDWLDNSTGALLVDLDNDGDADLALATRTAFLVMENNGAGKFSLIERFSSIPMGYSPSAADYDLDGDLDLLVLRYAGDGGKTGDFPTPHPFHSARNGGTNVLLQNQGNLGFADVTDECGLGVENYRFSFAASWEDYDNDGDVDLYIANDFGPNQLFQNERTHFTDASSQSGTQDWGFGMSATWADYDRDGHMDLYVSSMFSGAGNQVVSQLDFNQNMPEQTRSKYLKMVRGNTLMRNSGQGVFEDVTEPMAEGFGGWAWGAKFADFDNDGWEDLYVANGYISQPDTDDL